MSLKDDLDELERIDPQVRAARERLDDTIVRIVERSALEPTLKLAKRQAMLGMIEQAVLSMDQDRLSATLIAVSRRGYEITGEDVSEIVMRQDHNVQRFWTGDCPCGRDLH